MGDQNELWVQILVWVANISGVVYNLPQIYHTYLTKKVDDISTISISMRLLSSLIWTFYCSYFSMWGIGLSWIITLISSMLIIYYKVEKQVIDESINRNSIQIV